MGKSKIFERILRWTHSFPWFNLLHDSVPLLFFLLMFFMFPFRERIEFDPDEGPSTMIALLISRGFSMYSEIWSDHPPLFPYLLAAWFRAFGFNLNAGRVFVLLLSTALLGAAYQFLRSTWGIWHAITGVILIILLPFYTTLSVSVMIGLPAIALAMLSLMSLVTWHQRHNSLWLVFSAAALGFSVLIKLFTGFLAPIFLVGILIDQKARLDKAMTWRIFLRPVIIWSLVFAGVSLGLGLILVKPENIAQLINIHLAARQIELYINLPEAYTLGGYLRESWPFLLLAIFGSIIALMEKNWLSLYLVAWAATAYLLLRIQVPVWYHQQLLITIPCAMLAAIAVGQAIRQLMMLYREHDFFNVRSLLTAVATIGFVFALLIRVPETYLDFTTPVYLLEREKMILVRMSNHAPETQWVVTDLPMYAFLIDRPVPPSLAVISDKRIATGDLTEDKIIEAIEKYNPEQVLIGRFKFPKLEQYLQEDYRLLYSRGKRNLYLLKTDKVIP